MSKLLTLYGFTIASYFFGLGTEVTKTLLLIIAFIFCEILALYSIIVDSRSFDDWKYNCDNDGDMDG